MKDFDIAKYLRENHLGSHAILGAYVDLHALKEEVDMPVTIELDMQWDSSDDADAQETFRKYNITVSGPNGRPGTYMVSGKKEDILAYLRSEFYGMDSESIQYYYPELLDGMNEEDYGNNKPVDEVPYVGTDDKLDGFGDEFDQVEPVSELEKPENIYADDEDSFEPSQDRIMDLGGEQIEQGIISLLDDGFEPEDILDACKMFIDAHVNAAMQGKKF